jgi:thiol-disulfide isomerase/thioredoxin
MGSSPLPRFALAAAVALLAGCSKEPALGEPFVTSTLEQALAAAGQQGKVVFVDFGATWCGPCKRLAATTLVDTKVRDWLREHTVPLRIDIDEAKDLAAEFHIDSVPTMLFLRPDRSELGRITGYRDADALLAEAEQRLQGISAVDEAKAAVTASPRDAQKQMTLMHELTAAGKYEEALTAADAYWEASRSSMAQAGVRRSFFLSDMEALAAKYPPASERMRSWLRDARRRVESGKPDIGAAMDFTALAQKLGESEAVLDVATALEKRGADGKAAAGMLAAIASKELVAARHYALVANSGMCTPAMVKTQLSVLKSMPQVPGMTDETRTLHRFAIEHALPAFEALAGVGRLDEAKEIADAILRFDGSAEVRGQLVAAAKRAGNEELAKEYSERR